MIRVILPDGVSWYVITTVTERSEVTRVSCLNKKADAYSGYFFFSSSRGIFKYVTERHTHTALSLRRMQRETNKSVKSMTGRAISSTSLAATGGGKVPGFVPSRWV